MFENAFMVMSASAVVGKFLETFKDFPPVQRPNTFTIDQAMEKMQASLSDH
jgi:arylsulfatase